MTLEYQVKLKIRKPSKNKIVFTGWVKNIRLSDFDLLLKDVLRMKFEELESEYDLKVKIKDEGME